MKKGIYIFFLLFTIESTILNYNTGQISDDMILHEWSQSGNQLSELQQLQIVRCALSLQSYSKLFSLQLPKLKTIKLHHNSLNKFILKTIFNSHLLSQLYHLQLVDCNIDDKMLQFAILNRNVTIQKLTLDENLISRLGWKSLARLKFINGLKQLKIDKNSLYYDESVDSLASLNLSQINNISISHTLISSSSFFKLIQYVSLQNLNYLRISDNIFPEEFYKNLSKISMPNLKVLDLSYLDLDEDILIHLKNWKLEKLQVLMIEDNFLNDLSMQYFITHQNMPNLHCLNISANNITKKGIKHLVDNNFNFKTLNLGKNQLMNEGILQILNFKKLDILQDFSISENLINTQHLKIFFSKAPLHSIKRLNISFMPQVTGLFGFLPYDYFLNLDYLTIRGTDVRVDFQKILSKKFPNLVTFSLTDSLITIQNLKNLIKKLRQIAPKIKNLVLSKNLQISLIHPSFFKNVLIPQNCIVTMDNIILKQINNKPNLIFINIKYYLDLFCPINQRCFDLFADELLNGFIFEQISNIIIKDKYQYLAWKYIIQKITKLTKLTTLVFLQTKVSSDELLYQIIRKQIPSLSVVVFAHNKWLGTTSPPYGQEDTYVVTNKTLQYLKHPKFKNLISIGFYNVTVNLSQFFKDISFPLLQSILIQSTMLKGQQLQKILCQALQNSPLTDLYISNNAIQKYLTHSLARLNHTITRLDISNIPLGDQIFENLAQINSQFFRQFRFQQTSVSDSGIQRFINKKKKENLVIFPMLNKLFIGSNPITSKGFKLLLSTSIPYLTFIQQIQAQNPSLINDILMSQSKRINSILAITNHLDSINPSISYKSTRRWQNLIFQARNIKSQVFQKLSNFQFPRLSILVAFINQLDCLSLKAILKIAQHAKKIIIHYLNQDYPLYDQSCIDENFTLSLVKAQLIQIKIQTSFYLPKLTKYLLTPYQHLIQLSLPNFYLSDDIFLKFLSYNSFEKLEQLILSGWDLSDQSMIKFFSLQLKNLITLSLAKNQKITWRSLEPLKNRILQKMNSLQLDSTSIGNQGIQILKTVRFPVLQILSLCNTGFDRKGLQALQNLFAPKLKQLDISMNNLTQQDLENFDFLHFQQLEVLAIYIKGGINSKIYDKILKQATKNKKNFKLMAQIHYLQVKNYADIHNIQ